MSLELEQWLLEEYKEGLKEGEDRVAALFKRMKANGRLQDFSDALKDKNARENYIKNTVSNDRKDTVSNDRKAPCRTRGAFFLCLKSPNEEKTDLTFGAKI